MRLIFSKNFLVLFICLLVLGVTTFFIFRDLGMIYGAQYYSEIELGPVIASLTLKERDVRRRFNEDVIWSDIHLNDSVHQKDYIATLNDSGAKVEFEDGTSIEVNENSLVIVEKTQDPGKTIIDLLRGNIYGKFSERVAEGRTMEIKTKGKRSVLKSKGAEIAVKSDKKKTDIVILGGEAVIESEEKQVVIKENHKVTIDVEGKISEPKPLLLTLLKPERNLRIFYTGEIPKVVFEWETTSPRGETEKKLIGEFQIEISRDSVFSDIIFTESINETELIRKMGEDGTFFWRASGINPGTGKREYSEERKFSMFIDRPPSLLTPSDNAELSYRKLPQPVEFIWTPVPSVSQYRIQISEDLGFRNSPVDEIINESRFISRELNQGRYYWRVRNVIPDREESGFTNTRSFAITEIPVSPPPKLFMPEDNKSISFKRRPIEDEYKPNVIFTWQPVQDARGYLIEIAKDESFSGILHKQELEGASFTWSNITQGTYYWRVKSIDPEDRETSFGEVRRIEYFLRPPALIYPEKYSAISNIDVISTQADVELKWSEVKNAQGYQIEIARDKDFSDVVFTGEHEAPSMERYLPPGTYFWRVRMFDPNNQASDYSEANTFTITYIKPPEPPLIETPPEYFVEYMENQEITLEWGKLKEAVEYEIRISRDEEFKEIILAYNTPENSYTITDIPDGNYFWKVRALDNYKRGGEYSRPGRLRVKLIDVLAPPILRKPESDKKFIYLDKPPEIEFTWEPTGELKEDKKRYFKNYHFVLSKDGEFDDVLIDTDVKDRGFRLDHLTKGTYFWRVNAVDKIGRGGEYSKTRKLILDFKPPLDPPTLKGPSDNREITYLATPPEISFRWKKVRDAIGYRLEISRDERFETVVASLDARRPSISYRDLEQGRYYWRVQGIDRIKRGGRFSKIRQLILKVKGILFPPKLISPINNFTARLKKGIVEPIKMVFSWEKAGRATEYIFNIGRDRNMEDVVYKTTTPDTSVMYALLEPDTYYWYVTPVANDGSTGKKSKVRKFTVRKAASRSFLDLGFNVALMGGRGILHTDTDILDRDLSTDGFNILGVKVGISGFRNFGMAVSFKKGTVSYSGSLKGVKASPQWFSLNLLYRRRIKQLRDRVSLGLKTGFFWYAYNTHSKYWAPKVIDTEYTGPQFGLEGKVHIIPERLSIYAEDIQAPWVSLKERPFKSGKSSRNKYSCFDIGIEYLWKKLFGLKLGYSLEELNSSFEGLGEQGSVINGFAIDSYQQYYIELMVQN